MLATAGTVPLASLYIFPELSDNPREFISATNRVVRVSRSGISMAMSYYLQGINSTSHSRNATVLKDAIVANGGVYIKLG